MQSWLSVLYMWSMLSQAHITKCRLKTNMYIYTHLQSYTYIYTYIHIDIQTSIYPCCQFAACLLVACLLAARLVSACCLLALWRPVSCSCWGSRTGASNILNKARRLHQESDPPDELSIRCTRKLVLW